jgi:feruloyl esterase
VAASAVTSNADGVALLLPAHCGVVGKMNPRTGIDGKSYAINFEMRLPTNWNGRFFHQVNGGNDGFINTDTTRAFGRKLGGSPTSNGLIDGFAVLTSDAGHTPDAATYPSDTATGLGISGQVFGLDPQARKDYGYAAVGSLTPMAKSLIAAAYGRGPDRSYMIGRPTADATRWSPPRDLLPTMTAFWPAHPASTCRNRESRKSGTTRS